MSRFDTALLALADTAVEGLYGDAATLTPRLKDTNGKPGPDPSRLPVTVTVVRGSEPEDYAAPGRRDADASVRHLTSVDTATIRVNAAPWRPVSGDTITIGAVTSTIGEVRNAGPDHLVLYLQRPRT